jgi:hypothetical protein
MFWFGEFVLVEPEMVLLVVVVVVVVVVAWLDGKADSSYVAPTTKNDSYGSVGEWRPIVSLTFQQLRIT